MHEFMEGSLAEPVLASGRIMSLSVTSLPAYLCVPTRVAPWGSYPSLTPNCIVHRFRYS